MAIDKTYTGNGSTTAFDITFPYLEVEDINVAVKPSGGSYATKVLGTDYSVSNMQVVFGSAPANNSTVRIRRSTKITAPRHVHYAGSSLTAGSLNDNNRQLLYAMEERGLTGDDTGTVEFDTGAKGDIYIHSSTNVTLQDNVVDGNALADNSVGTSHYVDDSIEHVHLKNDCIDGDNIQNNAINSEHYANDSINAAHYAPGSVDSTAIGNDQVNSQHYAAASIDNEHLADDAVGIDELSASGTASSSTFLRGDNSWKTLIESAPAGFQIGFGYASTTTKKEFTEDNTWQDSGLEITYTPKSSSSLLLIEARPILRCRPDGEQRSAYFEVRYELDNSGSDLDGAIGVNYGHAPEHADYSEYVATANQPILVTAVYTNSNTNQKIFKVQCRAPTETEDFMMNTDTASYGLSTGKSYITIKEIAN